MSKINVLIFPAGEVNSIELHDALSHNVNIEVFGASSIERHGSYVFKNYKEGLPLINEKDFVKKFNALIDEWKIDLIFPTHDTVTLFLAKNQEQINAKIVGADLETAIVCRDKRKTYEMFEDYSFCPKIFSELGEFPVFIKPREGQGAIGAKLILEEKEVPNDLVGDDYVITEYLPGEELTVDCLTDCDGKLRAVLPRQRKRTMAGICVSGKNVDCGEEIRYIAKEINNNLHFRGFWYFQIKKDKMNKYKLLEVSARCSGTMCLSRARGINLAQLTVYTIMGKEISVFQNPYEVEMDRTLITRYKINYKYNTVYLDYDDTLIEKDKVCIPAIQFLYQCKNQGKKVVLISRHEMYFKETIIKSLDNHSIDVGLFDDIISIKPEEQKSDYIKPEDAIFIDNSYVERKKIHDLYNIPVFDVEGFEVLLDWRS